ncbi:unnamed protein product [Cylindrotheca closterium]|uniref:Uncharacterized protein n=1 Tax=Cylindrotheca closterium TaxID=2856 RepID=A0AAD2G3L0_9STRA|nr:unnamed protein product [Cylindrotheca closterium]
MGEGKFLGGVFDDVDIDEIAEFREQDYEERMAEYNASQNKNASKSQRERDLARVLVPLLAMQCYHLPGNNWRQDLAQYIANNHPVFGIFLHHNLHPIGSKTRIFALVGTLVFGLALTSFFELLYIKYPSYQKTLLAFGSSEQGWELTSGMLSLWTVGGGIHTAYNLFVWHIAACSCMREGGCMESAPSFCRCPSFGKTFVRIFVILIIALSIFVVCLKVAIANDGSAEADAVADLDNYQSADDFGFVVAYFVGMGLSFFVWYFLGLFVLFSGVLGCYKLPVLGGRPREVAIEEKLIANTSNASTKSSNPFDDLESPKKNSSRRSDKNNSFVGGSGRRDDNKKSSSRRSDKSNSFVGGSDRDGMKHQHSSLKKGKKKSKRDIETGLANDLEQPSSKKKLSKEKSKRKENGGQSPSNTRELVKKPSSRKKKQAEGKMNSSKLVFQPL